MHRPTASESLTSPAGNSQAESQGGYRQSEHANSLPLHFLTHTQCYAEFAPATIPDQT